MKKNLPILVIILIIALVNSIFFIKIRNIAHNQYENNFFLFEVNNFIYLADKIPTLENSNFVALDDNYQNFENDKYLFTNSQNYIYSSLKNSDFKTYDFNNFSFLKKYFINNYGIKKFIIDNCANFLYENCFLKVKNELSLYGYFLFPPKSKILYVETENIINDYYNKIQLFKIKEHSNKILDVNLNYNNSSQVSIASKNYIVIELDEILSANENQSNTVLLLRANLTYNDDIVNIKNIFFDDKDYPVNIFFINTLEGFKKPVLGINKIQHSFFINQFCNSVYNKCSYYNISPQLLNREELLEDLKNLYHEFNIKVKFFDLNSQDKFNLALNFDKKLRIEDINNQIIKNHLIKANYYLSNVKSLTFYNSLFYTNIILGIALIFYFFTFSYKKNINKYDFIILGFFFITFLIYNQNLNFNSMREWGYHSISLNFILFYLLFKLTFKNIFNLKFRYQIITIFLILDFLIFFFTFSVYFFTFYILIDLILYLLRHNKNYGKKK